MTARLCLYFIVGTALNLLAFWSVDVIERQRAAGTRIPWVEDKVRQLAELISRKHKPGSFPSTTDTEGAEMTTGQTDAEVDVEGFFARENIPPLHPSIVQVNDGHLVIQDEYQRIRKAKAQRLTTAGKTSQPPRKEKPKAPTDADWEWVTVTDRGTEDDLIEADEQQASAQFGAVDLLSLMVSDEESARKRRPVRDENGSYRNLGLEEIDPNYERKLGL
jgi:hypothetical protein